MTVSMVGLKYYLAYPFLLLSIIPSWSVLRSIVRALYNNSRQIIQTVVLIAVVIYLYAVWGFRYLSDSFVLDSDVDNCSDLLNCFLTSFSRGLRAFGGIGDALTSNSVNHGSSEYWGRYWYDLTAFLLINGLLLCLLWGIIVDALSEMQREYNSLQQDINSICFVCGIHKFELETKGRGWKRHIKEEHAVADYMCYLIYIDEKTKTERSELETYVKKRKDVHAVDFFPIGKALSIKVGGDKERENLATAAAANGSGNFRPEGVEELKGMIGEVKQQMKDLKLHLTSATAMN